MHPKDIEIKYNYPIYMLKNLNYNLITMLPLLRRCDIGGCERPRANTFARARPRVELLGTASVISAIRVPASTALDAGEPEQCRVAI